MFVVFPLHFIISDSSDVMINNLTLQDYLLETMTLILFNKMLICLSIYLSILVFFNSLSEDCIIFLAVFGLVSKKVQKPTALYF